MAGTKEGARKARDTNKKKYGDDFYAKIGAKSWDDPDRSHETGFALLPPEERKRLGAIGGSKNKGKKYKKHEEDDGTEETLAILQEEMRRSTEGSE